MTINISRFPHAHYDPDLREGHLCRYYSYNSSYLDKDAWRHESYSPEILNYKEGTEKALQYFASEYRELLRHVMQQHPSYSRLVLVPVPSSTPDASADYTKSASVGVRKNRDSRNKRFCRIVADLDNSFTYFHMLERVQPKPPKVHWSAQKNAASMIIRGATASVSSSDLIVLVDDVRTAGGTIQGAKLKLSEQFSPDQIILLPIAQTFGPFEFVSLIV